MRDLIPNLTTVPRVIYITHTAQVEAFNVAVESASSLASPCVVNTNA